MVTPAGTDPSSANTADAPSRVIVIGGDAAGMSAATRVARHPRWEVMVYDREPVVSYAACGMPYHLDGRIPDATDLLIRSPDEFRAGGVDLRLEADITTVDPDAGTITGRDVNTGETFTDRFDRLLIATGARALCPPIDGVDAANVHVFRRFGDLGRLTGFLDEHQPATATVVGGGFIGIELAEVLTDRGLTVTLVEMAPALMPGALDADIAGHLADELTERGVTLHLGSKVTSFRLTGGLVAGIEATDPVGVPLAWDTDVVVLGAGVAPNGELASAAGIEVDARGAIVVDDQMRTSHPKVWAAGDCATTVNRVTGRAVWVPLALSANRQGRIAGQNLIGGAETSPGLVGTSLVKAFDLHVGRAGLTEAEAADAGFEPAAATITGSDRAHYYPGRNDLVVKLVADRATGRLLGGQVAGRDGVAGRTNVIATALHTGLAVADVADLDLGYAPPFSPVWDPVLVAASQLLKRLR
ncbi:MAG: FAD-dependent oxidoreductase [Acidimicrobiales bacterium]